MQHKLSVEEIRPLTLSDISPKWAKRLEQLPISPLSFRWLRWYFEIICASKCLVGEAYGFSSAYAYKCKECGKIGDKFTLYFILLSHTKLEENKQRFVKHWNEKHIEICIHD